MAEEQKPISPEDSAEEAIQQHIQKIQDCLDADDLRGADALVKPLHYADQAQVLVTITAEAREKLIAVMRDYFDPQILAQLESDLSEEVLALLGSDAAARAISKLDPDEAVWVLEDIEKGDQQDILDAVPHDIRERLEEGLSYPDSSAGRIMRQKTVLVPSSWNVGDTIDFLRTNNDEMPEEFYSLFITDADGKVIGDVLLSQVIRSKREVALESLMNVGIRLVPATMDQEEVARLFRKYGMVSAPVVDEDGIVVGMITVDDVVDIIEEEADEDLLRLGGVAEQDFYSAIAETVKKRFPWLMVNLMTAMISASVIGMFQGSIQHLVVLAALMPVVASIGGNAGTQAMTVAVRALAGKELSNVNALRVIGKEMLVAAANGTLLAMIAGLVVVAWQDGDFGVASVFAIAVVINMAIAGLVGVLVPYSLSRVKIDPAISSGVFVTGTTDMMGFLVFLGLASLWLL